MIQRISSMLKSARFRWLYKGSLKLPKDVAFRKGFSIQMERIGEARLSIGSRCFFNNYCSINCLDSISIGDDCLFGEGVRIYDHDHYFDSRAVYPSRFKTAPVVIGDGCWLGSNVVVLKGVTIGDNVVVAAGTVVCRDVPANSLVRNRTELLVVQRHY